MSHKYHQITSTKETELFTEEESDTEKQKIEQQFSLIDLNSFDSTFEDDDDDDSKNVEQQLKQCKSKTQVRDSLAISPHEYAKILAKFLKSQKVLVQLCHGEKLSEIIYNLPNTNPSMILFNICQEFSSNIIDIANQLNQKKYNNLNILDQIYYIILNDMQIHFQPAFDLLISKNLQKYKNRNLPQQILEVLVGLYHCLHNYKALRYMKRNDSNSSQNSENLSRQEQQKKVLEELSFNPAEYWKNRFISIKGKIQLELRTQGFDEYINPLTLKNCQFFQSKCLINCVEKLKEENDHISFSDLEDEHEEDYNQEEEEIYTKNSSLPYQINLSTQNPFNQQKQLLQQS